MEQINKRKYKNGDIYMATTDTKGEIESEQGELGQLMQLDGTFIDDHIDIERKELNIEYIALKKKKTAFDLGAITADEYAPFKARLIEVATLLGII